jgi:hypothetical protein
MSCQRGGPVRGKGGCGRGIRALTMDGDEASVLLALDVAKAESNWAVDQRSVHLSKYEMT